MTLPSRLDAYLVTLPGIISRSKGAKLIEDGNVEVNSNIVRKSSAYVKAGDRVTVHFPPLPSLQEETSEASSLTVLFEDPSCIVILKPAGLIVHPGAGVKKGVPTVLSEARALFAERKLRFSQDAVLVHRLDKDTTGCLLLAKDPKSHVFFQKQFAEREIQKTYLALVHGVPSLREAHIDAPIGRSNTNRRAMSVFSAGPQREAHTTYHVLGTSSDRGTSLLSIDLHTGRTHQIRVHLGAIGHPVVGDPMYGVQGQKDDVSSICLHAWKLGFTLPNGKRKEVRSPLPSSFVEVLRQLKIPVPTDGR